MFCSRCGQQVDTSTRFCPSCGLDLSTVTGAGQGATAMMTAQPKQEDETSIVREALKEEYELEKELGRGGMAVVYKARDKQLEREVAIKVLPFSLSFDAEFVERFQREARTAGKLEHPNIIPIYRVGRSGRVIYFVMKFIRGKSLSAVIEERGALPVPEIKRLLIEASRALGYAHKHGIVHRDIKPDNIMFDELGQAIVTDFGIAKAQSGARLTGTGMSIGTPHYMSPEQARAQNLDGRSDIYSLGVVAYQCLTGHVPFDGEDSFSIGYKHIMEELPTPQLETAEQRELFAVVQKMMQKKPDDRFQSAEELIQALEGGGGVAPVDMTTMPTRAIEPMKAPTAKAGPSPVTTAATAPLPRASASMGKPAEAAAAAKPAAARPARPRPESKSKAPLAIAAVVVVALIGAAVWFFVLRGAGQPTTVAAGTPPAVTPTSAPGPDTAAARPGTDTAKTPPVPDTAKAAPPTEGRKRPEPAAPAAPSGPDGTISLNGVIPPGARITVAQRQYPGPRIKHRPGTFPLRIEARGYQPFSQMVTVRPTATTTVNVTMLAVEPQPATGTTPGAAPAAAPAPGAPDARCAQAGFNRQNRNNACRDVEPTPRIATQVEVPTACTGTVQRVRVLVQVSATGDVQVAQRQSSSGCEAFDQIAVAFANELSFSPATKGGTPVMAWREISINPIRR